jgi:hypothetical protein
MNRAHAPTETVIREAAQASLTVTVLFTDVPHTLDALSHAAVLSGNLNAKLRILVPVIVPYPLDLEEAPIDQRHLERRLTTVANGVGIPTRLNVVHCRDREQAVEKCLEPHSIVVIGWRRRFLFDRTARLARRLRKLGHHVVIAGIRKGI